MKYWNIHFEPSDLEIDRDGDLENYDALYILEHDGKDIRRVSIGGQPMKLDRSIDEIESMSEFIEGYEFDSLQETINYFETWLANNLEWRESSPATWDEPAEYVCTGLVSDEPRPFKRSRHDWTHLLWRKR